MQANWYVRRVRRLRLFHIPTSANADKQLMIKLRQWRNANAKKRRKISMSHLNQFNNQSIKMSDKHFTVLHKKVKHFTVSHGKVLM